jgi:hypothetical protein
MQENQQYFFQDFSEFESKTFFFNFFDVLTKTGYFNTGFVSLRYKNTNQY